VGPRNYALDRGPDPPRERNTFEGGMTSRFFCTLLSTVLTGCDIRISRILSTSVLTRQLQKQSSVTLNFPNEKPPLMWALIKILRPLVTIILWLTSIKSQMWAICMSIIVTICGCDFNDSTAK